MHRSRTGPRKMHRSRDLCILQYAKMHMSMAYLKLLRPRNHHQVWGQAKLTFELRTLLNILLLLLLIIDFTERSALLDPKLGDDF